MIHFGYFNAFDSRTPAVEAAAKECYAKLSAGMQTFFHEVLPPLLMATGVGVINEKTYRVFARRWAVVSYCHVIEIAQYQFKCERKADAALNGVTAKLDDFTINKLTEAEVEEAVVRFLTKFNGVVSNVPTETDAEFHKRMNSRERKFGRPQIRVAARLARQLTKDAETKVIADRIAP